MEEAESGVEQSAFVLLPLARVAVSGLSMCPVELGRVLLRTAHWEHLDIAS